MSDRPDRPPGKKPFRPGGKPKPWEKKRGGPSSSAGRQDRDRREEKAESEPLIFGNHAAEAALRNPDRRIRKALFTENAERRFGSLARERKIPIEMTTPRDLDRRLGPDTVHQGVLLEIEPLEELELTSLVRRAAGRPIIVLDQVTDPHNVGAILRSAAVFGSGGLVMTRRHSPPPWGVLAKSASGALEHVPIAFVQNLARALSELRIAGCTVVGLDGDAETLLDEMDLTRPVALVLGAEGKGLRHLTRELCDRLTAIGTDGPLRSLNVSNAAAVALHLSAMQRRTKPDA